MPGKIGARSLVHGAAKTLERVLLFCSAIATALLLIQRAYPQSYKGNTNTLFYAWRTESADRDTSQTHILLSEQLRLSCTNVLAEGLSFHTYVRALKDFAPDDSANFERIFRLHNMYAQYSPSRWADVRLGRQYLSLGVARGSVDGVALRIRVPRASRLSIFAGLGVSGDSLILKSWSESSLFGGQLASSFFPGTDLSLSFINRSVRDTNIQQEAGLEARFRLMPGLRPSIGADYSLLSEGLKRIHIGISSFELDLVSAYINYTYTKPTFPENSFFSEFETPGYGRARLGVSYYPKWIASWSGVYVTSLYEEETSHYVELSADGDWASIGVGHSFGYGGGRSGVYVSTFYPVTPRLEIAAGVDYARYRIAALGSESGTEDDLAAHLGGSFAFLKDMELLSRIEYLLNEDYEYDIRFLSTLSVGFGR